MTFWLPQTTPPPHSSPPNPQIQILSEGPGPCPAHHRLEDSSHTHSSLHHTNRLHRTNPCPIPTRALYSSTNTLFTRAPHQTTEKGTPLQPQQHNHNGIIVILRYLAYSTRPDIAHSTSALATHITNPSFKHWQAAIRVLKYLKATKNVGLQYH